MPIASAGAALIGCLVLVGWALEVEALKSIIPGRTAMNPTTALAFAVAGASLWLQGAPGAAGAGGRSRVARLAAGAVALLGLATLVGYLVGQNLGLDQLLFGDRLGGNRIAPNTGLNLLLLGSALVLIDAETRDGRRLAQLLAIVTGVIASVSLVGYAYGVGALYGVASFIPMALNTALAFALLAVGVLAARRDRGLMAIATSRSGGGIMLRRLLPAAVLLPAGLGFFCLQGQQAGLYDAPFGLSLVVVISVVVSAALIWRTAGSLERAERERRAAEAERERQRAEADRLREERRRELEEELARAARVQADLLPRDVPALPAFDLAARCLPAREVGGDFFDWHEPTPGVLTLTLGDVVGKGMPAALLMTTVRAALEAVARQTPPAPAMQAVAAALDRDLQRARSFITLFHARANAATRCVDFVDAGHGHVFLRRSDGRVEGLEPRGLPLGVLPDQSYESGTVRLEPGDVMVVYSDGLVDGRPDLALTPAALAERLADAADAHEIVERLVALATPDGPLPDDLTLVVLRCREAR